MFLACQKWCYFSSPKPVSSSFTMTYTHLGSFRSCLSTTIKLVIASPNVTLLFGTNVDIKRVSSTISIKKFLGIRRQRCCSLSCLLIGWLFWIFGAPLHRFGNSWPKSKQFSQFNDFFLESGVRKSETKLEMEFKNQSSFNRSIGPRRVQYFHNYEVDGSISMSRTWTVLLAWWNKMEYLTGGKPCKIMSRRGPVAMHSAS